MELFVLDLLLYVLLFVLLLLLIAVALLYKLGVFYRLSHKVERDSTRHGGELVAEALKAHGVKYVFTLVGGHISPILVACDKIGIRVIDTRHEVTCVFAADAVARLSGTVGVAAVTAGPGLTNTVTAVKNAQMAESAVLLIGGAAATLLKGRGALQDIDQMSLFRPLCKFTATVRRLRDIRPTITRALHIAQSDTPGPVFVEFPIDTLYPYKLVEHEAGVTPGKTLGQRIINMYLQNHIDDVFAGAWEPAEVRPRAPVIPAVSPALVQQSVELVSRAKKPVMLIGSQATLPPCSVDKLHSAVQRIGVPCFLGGMARGLLGRNSAIQFRHCRRDALKDADLVILAGSVCDFRLGYGRALSRKSNVIAINRSKQQLYKNSDVFWKPRLALLGDVAGALTSLADGLDEYTCDSEWIDELRQRDDSTQASNRAMCSQTTDVHLNPVNILHTLEQVMSHNSVIVADGGDFVGTAAYILRPRGALQWLDPGAFGTLGCGAGFALGAKLCRPDCDVWLVYGDGSLAYSVAEFDTFTRHQIPVIAVVGNDACWSQIARDQLRIFERGTACHLAFCKYHVVAEGYGGVGMLLDRTNEAQMQDVFVDAQRRASEGHSVLINCLIGKTNFRDGSISV